MCATDCSKLAHVDNDYGDANDDAMVIIIFFMGRSFQVCNLFLWSTLGFFPGIKYY